MKTQYKKLGENFILGKRFISRKWNSKHYEKIVHSRKKSSEMKIHVRNVIENLKN